MASKVVTVIGTRPEIIKLAPLIPLLDKAFDHTFIFTGQHYSANMVDVFFDELNVRHPDVWLNVASSDDVLLEEAIKAELDKYHVDYLVIYGDTNSTLAAARAAGPNVSIVHLEAGIRSFDLRMKEELNRIETDKLSTFRLAPTILAQYFLTELERYPQHSVKVVGNLVVDTYYMYEDKINDTPLVDGLNENDYSLLTLHRKENVDDPKRLASIIRNVARIKSQVVLPIHPRTRSNLDVYGIELPKNVMAIPPQGYFEFMRLLKSCKVVLTDSGGVQEEAITLKVPCITLRDNTERMETVYLGANELYEAEKREDLAELVEKASGRKKFIESLKNPYGDGASASRIVKFLSGAVTKFTHVPRLQYLR